jgi:hypothetical protein
VTAPISVPDPFQLLQQGQLTPVPSSEKRDWREWVSATQTSAFMHRDPLLDWLKAHGREHKFRPDDEYPDFDPRMDATRFLQKQGRAFEQAVLQLIRDRFTEVRQIAHSPKDIENPEKARETLMAMKAGVEVIYQGVLHDEASRTYGAPDLLVRSDLLQRLVPEPYAAERTWLAKRGARPAEISDQLYRVVDIKFSTLELLTSGELGNSMSASGPARKAQLFIYNRALGQAQTYEPPSAFLLGRGWKQGQGKKRGNSCLERLAFAPQAAELGDGQPLSDAVEEACRWIRRLRSAGASWTVLPEPDVHELRPNMGNSHDSPWHRAKSRIAEQLKDLTLVWNIGAKARDDLARGCGGTVITQWDDPALTPGLAGVNGPKEAPVLQAILDVNRQPDGVPVRPPRITAAQAEWRQPQLVEFFVDFETTNGLDDDFRSLPQKGGQSLIFMVGCGHVVDGQFHFRCFTAEALTEFAEADILDQWFAHMDEVQARVGFEGKPLVFHWSNAERSVLEDAYNSARRRHPERSWLPPRWFDFLKQVVRPEPVVVRGALGFGLKDIGKALQGAGLIQTSWQDGPTDGQGAMVGAWSAAEEARRSGGSLREVPLTHGIERYNEVDCRVMYEVISYLRQHH